MNKQAWTCQQEKADISYSVNLLYKWFFQRSFEAKLLCPCPYQVVQLKENPLWFPVLIKRKEKCTADVAQWTYSECSHLMPRWPMEKKKKHQKRCRFLMTIGSPDFRSDMLSFTLWLRIQTSPWLALPFSISAISSQSSLPQVLHIVPLSLSASVPQHVLKSFLAFLLTPVHLKLLFGLFLHILLVTYCLPTRLQ